MLKQFQCGPVSLSSDIDIAASHTLETHGFVTVCDFTVNWKREDSNERSALTLSLRFPIKGFQHMWQPGGRMQRFLKTTWAPEFQPVSMATMDAPVFCYYDGADRNVKTVAFSETRKALRFRSGVEEKSGDLEVNASISLDQFPGGGPYRVLVYIDETPCDYGQALGGVRQWWNDVCGITPMTVPTAAKEPLYSTWYGFHHDVTAKAIEDEAALAAEYGMKTLIVDDGWQVPGGSDPKMYSYCGDWEIAKDKFPDMAAHVKRVQALGIKYMIWYSVPFMGFLSRRWEQFKDKLLHKVEFMGAGVLDPRFPEVREYLISTYADALRNYGYDGFKLDFIDSFDNQGFDMFRRHIPAPLKPEMDIPTIQDAVMALMCGVRDTLTAIKPDIMLEFRQHYTGPNMQSIGNMFRVMDCPYDSVSNRVGIADLRMLSGSSAVHSDPIMWHGSEEPEDAAQQVLSALFGVAQYGKMLANLPENHQKMLKFWIGFTLEHKSLLLDNPLQARQPHFLYPVISTQNEAEQVVAVYSDLAVADIEAKTVYAVNASFAASLLLRSGEERTVELTVYDCMGAFVRCETVALHKGVNDISVPRSGLAVIR